MFVLDGHKSHLSNTFQKYSKEYNIITLCFPIHSLYITQPFDVGCFNVLKRIYGREIEVFVKASITYITKLEFFIAFKIAYNQTMTSENVQAGFKGTSLISFNLEAIISKFDIKL